MTGLLLVKHSVRHYRRISPLTTSRKVWSQPIQGISAVLEKTQEVDVAPLLSRHLEVVAKTGFKPSAVLHADEPVVAREGMYGERGT
jgi:hypothetical protein